MSGTLTDPGPYGDKTDTGSTVAPDKTRPCSCGCGFPPQECPNR